MDRNRRGLPATWKQVDLLRELAQQIEDHGGDASPYWNAASEKTDLSRGLASDFIASALEIVGEYDIAKREGY